MEKKEIERAENNAHLAYHYYKLSKYMDNDNLEKYQHLISNGQEDNGRIQKKSNVKKSNGPVDDRINTLFVQAANKKKE